MVDTRDFHLVMTRGEVMQKQAVVGADALALTDDHDGFYLPGPLQPDGTVQEYQTVDTSVNAWASYKRVTQPRRLGDGPIMEAPPPKVATVRRPDALTFTDQGVKLGPVPLAKPLPVKSPPTKAGYKAPPPEVLARDYAKKMQEAEKAEEDARKTGVALAKAAKAAAAVMPKAMPPPAPVRKKTKKEAQALTLARRLGFTDAQLMAAVANNAALNLTLNDMGGMEEWEMSYHIQKAMKDAHSGATVEEVEEEVPTLDLNEMDGDVETPPGLEEVDWTEKYAEEIEDALEEEEAVEVKPLQRMPVPSPVPAPVWSQPSQPQEPQEAGAAGDASDPGANDNPWADM